MLQSRLYTIEVYAKHLFPFPYPTIQAVSGPAGGIEYPMITFNHPLTTLEDDGTRTYSRGDKRRLKCGLSARALTSIQLSDTLGHDCVYAY